MRKYKFLVTYTVEEEVVIECENDEEAVTSIGDCDLHLSDTQEYIGDFTDYLVEVDGVKTI